MKTTPSILFLGLMIASAVHSAPPAPLDGTVPSAEKKTHTLFMGVDVSVERDKTFHRVRDVSRSSWIINVNGRPEIIPTERKALNLRVEQSLKLTEASATLANLRSERAYTKDNDPRMKSLVTQIQMESFTTEQMMAAEMKLSRATVDLAFYESADAAGSHIGPPPDPNKAMQDLAAASDFAASNLTNRQFYEGIENEQLKQENFDAIEVEFDVSSEKPLPNPYVIVVAQFHEKTAAPGMVQNWIYAQSLDPIDSTPRKVHLKRGGFPIGYTLEKVEVHLYNRGREVATNISPKRVPLTQEEAFQYLVIEHITANKGATVGATPVMAALPAELWTRLAAGEGQQAYYVKVSKDGLVSEVFEDDEHSRKVEDPFFAQALKKIWFKPALENGKPVETKTKVDVTKLRL